MPSLSAAAISWNEETRDAYNTITLRLRPNFEMVPLSVIRITGLPGFVTPDLPCGLDPTGGITVTTPYQPWLEGCVDWRLKLSGAAAHLFDMGDTAWRRQEGSLVLRLAAPSVGGEGGALRAGETYELSWQLRNGQGGADEGQAPATDTGPVVPMIEQLEPYAVPPAPMRRGVVDGPLCMPSNKSFPLVLDDYSAHEHELRGSR